MDIPEKYKRFIEPDPITRKKDIIDPWTKRKYSHVFWLKFRIGSYFDMHVIV